MPQFACDALMALPATSASEIGGRRGLAGDRPGRVDARLERVERPAQRVDRHRRGDVGGAREARGAEHGQREHGRARLRAVDQRQALFGRERDRAQAGARERVGARQSGAPSVTSASPSPTSTSARCASGARSPLAPTDPRDGHARVHAAR